MAYRKGTKGGKAKLPVDSDGPRMVPGFVGRTSHRKVQGRTGYTTGSRKGPGDKGRKISLPSGGS